MADRVFLSWKAEEDLADIYRHISTTDLRRAGAFLRSIEERCASLSDFPLQGRARNDLGPGYRVLFFAKRVVVLYRFDGERVEVLRVFYGGRDYERIVKGRNR